MASWSGSGNSSSDEEHRGEGSGLSALFETLRLPPRRRKADNNSESDESMFSMLDDACKNIRRTFSNASSYLSDWRDRSQSLASGSRRSDSGVGMSHGPRKVHLVRKPTGECGAFFDSVTIQLLPKTDGGYASNGARSAFSSIKSIMGKQSQSSDEELQAVVRQYTGGLDDDSGWNIAGTQKSCQNGRRLQRQEKAPSVCFNITYSATAGVLEVNFSCKAGFIKTLTEGSKANIVVQFSLSPGRRSEKVHLQKGRSQYNSGCAVFDDLTREDVRGKTLNVRVVSKGKALKRDVPLWQDSIRLQDLLVRKCLNLYWRE